MFKGRTLLLFTTMMLAIGAMIAHSPSAAAKSRVPEPAPTPDKSLFSQYRGVTIGMPTADVRTKLGNPKEKSDESDQFMFADSESALVYYDTGHSVKAIMITFQGDVTKAPTAKDIFGEDVAPNDQGMIFRMERYPKAGYWISYTRTSGTDAMVNIAMQKM